jgi:hypothetical protein
MWGSIVLSYSVRNSDFIEATMGFEPMNEGFADPKISTILRGLTTLRVMNKVSAWRQLI